MYVRQFFSSSSVFSVGSSSADCAISTVRLPSAANSLCSASAADGRPKVAISENGMTKERNMGIRFSDSQAISVNPTGFFNCGTAQMTIDWNVAESLEDLSGLV